MGFLHPNSKGLTALLQLLVFKQRAKDASAGAPDGQAVKTCATERPKLICRCCGAVMRVVRRRISPVMTPPARLNLESATSF
jgi:hypothetical protein